MEKFKLKERRLASGAGTEWMIIYSDLTTNLMLFFLMLFAITRLASDSKEKVFTSIKKNFTTVQEKARFQEIARVEDKTREEIGSISDMAKITITEKYISIELPNPVLFDPGGVDLKSMGKKVLGQISEILKPMHQQIIIEGHTDSKPVRLDGKYFSNWELSAARAMSAVNYLIKTGIAPELLSAVAYGSTRPVASNDTPEGRDKNRRIEINIVREQ